MTTTEVTKRRRPAKVPDPSEANVSEQIRSALAMAAPDLMLMRNEQGQTKNSRVLAGLGKGSADLVGVLRCTAGRFFALEVKARKGVVADHQTEWLDRVRSFGGFACVVRSAQEALDALARARRGESQ